MTNENIYQAPSSDLGVEEEPELVYAGFWIRVGASIVDSIIILLITLPILTAIYGASYWSSNTFIHGSWDFLFSYVFPAIAVILFWIYKSATPGKIVFGLRVISLGESKKLSTGQAIGRYFAYYPAMLIFFLGFIWVAFDKRKQGWHDKLANTAVIKSR